jgi:hypothetical protein
VKSFLARATVMDQRAVLFLGAAWLVSACSEDPAANAQGGGGERSADAGGSGGASSGSGSGGADGKPTNSGGSAGAPSGAGAGAMGLFASAAEVDFEAASVVGFGIEPDGLSARRPLVYGPLDLSRDLEGSFLASYNVYGETSRVFKVKNTGELLWTKVFQNLPGPYVTQIRGDAEGGVYVAATFDKPFQLDTWQLEPTVNPGTPTGQVGSQYGLPSRDAALIRIDREGHALWYKQFGGYSTQRAVSLDVTGSGDPFVRLDLINKTTIDGQDFVSSFGSTGSDTLDITLERATGLLASASQSVGSPGLAALDSEGNHIESGYASSSTDDGEPHGGWVAKRNSAGEVQWKVYLDEVQGPKVNVLVVTSDDSILIGTSGVRYAFLFGDERSTGVVRITPAGEVAFSLPIGHEEEYVTSLDALAQGSILIAGSFRNPIDFGQGTLQPATSDSGGTRYETNTLFLAHVDPDGSPLFSLRAGDDEESTWASSVLVLSDKQAIVSGIIHGRDLEGSTPYLLWLDL